VPPRVCAALLCLAAAGVSFGQFETATVLGTATNERAGAIPQARVSLANLDTGTSQSTVSDDIGNYQFLEVRVGRYRVIAESPGFKKLETAEFRVDVGARQRVDIKLEVGDVAETVQVNEAAVSVEVDSGDRGQVINKEAVVELPLNGRSNASLTLLSPGVRLAYGLAKRESSFNIGGLRSQFNNFILDGVNNNPGKVPANRENPCVAVLQAEPRPSGSVLLPRTEDKRSLTVAARIGDSPYSTSTSHTLINACVRSGTNQLHGTVWEFLHNTDLNATGFFKPVGGQKPVYIQNQFGGAAGGPIKKDKLFVFAELSTYKGESQ
jgi:hypothetical protein